MRNQLFVYLAVPLFLTLTACSATRLQTDSTSTIDSKLRRLLTKNNMKVLPKEEQPAAKVALGRMLYFDWILSGNKNISCATCHLPEAATSDALPLPMGEGGKGEMTARKPPTDETGKPVFVRRNSPDIFNRGPFKTMFWDGRVTTNPDDPSLNFIHIELLEKKGISSPAGILLPDGLDNALAAQAMFPPTSDVEMRGNFHENTLGSMQKWEWPKIWAELMQRLLAIEEYRQLFRAAYPDIPQEELTFVQAANAIASFEIDAFTFNDSPFDLYLLGDDNALSEAEKRGALLFYGKAGCAKCHSGPLMTDEKYHNRIVPQIGPGKGELPGGGPDNNWDAGRGGVTGMQKDFYCFRTPPLRNVAETGPWMHDGAFSTLEAAVRHELNPLESAKQYDPYKHLPDIYAQTCHLDQTEKVAALADPVTTKPVSLQAEKIEDLLAFLGSLTSPQLKNLVQITPQKVPSGLPVKD